MRYLLALVTVAVLLAGCTGGDDAHSAQVVSVARGDLREDLLELGELAPREPVRVVVRIHGKLQWVVEDQSWVEPGDVLFILDDDEALQQVAELRNELLQAEQERRLAELERAHAEQTERIALRAAQRRAELARIRHRILTTEPEGGDTLLELDRRLAPLEETAAAARSAYEEAFATYQDREAAFLAALEAWQSNRDRLLHLQSVIDELSLTTARDPAQLSATEREDQAADRERLTAARADLAAARAAQEGLTAALDRARDQRDEAEPARDQRRRELEEAEAAMRDLQVRVEIEKRGLPLTYLRLDREAVQLRLADARTDRERGQQAYAAGTISQLRLDELTQAVAALEDELAIIDERIAIESAGASAEAVAESAAELDLAEVLAGNAQEDFERTMALRDQDIAVAAAKVQRLEHQIARRAAVFPKVIESSIEFAQRELALLRADEVERRTELEAEIAELRAQLATAEAQPANVATAPVAGLVRIRRHGDRPKQPGDEVHEGDTMAEIYPSEDMDVEVAINESDIARVREGMSATVTIPALDDRRFTGRVAHLSRIGRDKLHHLADEGLHAGVTEYRCRIELAATDPDFRQGMSVLVAIVAREATDVLHLPRAAVTWNDAGEASVRVPDGTQSGERRRIEARLFGAEHVIVEAGLAAGDEVLVAPARREAAP